MGRPRSKKYRHLPPRLHPKDGAWYYVKQNKWTFLAHTYPDALREWAKIEGGNPAVTVSDLLDKYLAEVVPNKSERTQKDYFRHISILKKYFGHAGIGEVLPKHVAAYLEMGLDDNRGIQANREIAVLSAAYSKGVRWGIADFNPCLRVPRNTETPRQYVPSRKEIRKFYKGASKPLRRFIRLSLILGLRVEDVLRLDTDCITREGLEAKVSKTGNTILYEWTPSLTKTLSGFLTAVWGEENPETGMRVLLKLEIAPQTISRPLVEKERGRGRMTYWGLFSAWKRRREKVGGVMRPQDLRARALTDAHAERGRDYAQAMAAHASGNTTERYIRGRGLVRVRPLR